MSGLPVVQDYRLPDRDELPAGHVTWEIAPARALLLVHDMQNYFLDALPHRLRDDLVGRVADLTAWARRERIPTLYTAQPGRMSTADRGLLRDFWGEGMRMDDHGRDIVAPLVPDDPSTVLTKWRYSAFFRSDLRERMRANHVDQIVLCGVYAGTGLLATAVEAFTYDLQAFLVADAVADFSEAQHRGALDWVAGRCGRVLTSGQVRA